MKQIILLTAIFLMTASSNRSSAQNNNDVALNLKSLISATLIEKASEAKVTEVNHRAMRDFTRAFKNAPETKWFKTDKGYFASFSENGKNTKVVYDNRGQRTYSIISYPESKLNRQVRSRVKSVYFDATIIGVHQFEFDNKTIHVIKMLDQNSKFVTLAVTDEQIQDITTHDKK
jgi:hypothetical protein